MAKSSEPKPYKHKGCDFEYYLMLVVETDRWVADGYLVTEPDIKYRTQPLNTKYEAERAFVEWAKAKAGELGRTS